MNRLLVVIFCLLPLCAQAQRPYFQQWVEYKIDVRLDDNLHRLTGNWELVYVNRSPDTLDFLYMHHYPNAYRNNRTALAQQLLEQGNTAWHFDKKSERGYIDGLQYKDLKTGEELRLESSVEGHIDIGKIYLRRPLLPNDTLRLSTPFVVQMPASVSRMGHVDQSYQVTQWFPKPAVYDRKGWHPMPYLDQGEFYSEFGNFYVSITVPSNYVVGASGDLQNAEERLFLDSLHRATLGKNLVMESTYPDEFPPSASTTKTLRYRLEQAHDFAWFADKRFYVLKDTVSLASGRMVDVYAMFSKTEANLWKDATVYLRRSVRFYSDVVGEYPYNICTAVQSALSAGGGMEYPTITVIGKSSTAEALDGVIMHEVGHNWFYGILASNERLYPWMDEGWNSYVESRYMDAYYQSRDKTGYLAFLLQARRGMEQPMQTESSQSTSLNYYVGAYAKPTLLFRHAERYLGTERMDKVLQEYFRQWKFRHPYPEDLQALFETETGQSWNWLFKEAIGTAKRIDYAIKKYKFADGKASLTIGNEGELQEIAINIVAQDTAGKAVRVFWFSFSGKDTTIVLDSLPKTVASFEIDAFRNMPDVQPNNNKVYLHGVKYSNKPKDRLKIKLAADFRNPEFRRINLLPILGFNQYDGFMLGLAAYNLPVPLRKWQYIIAPMYGFRSNTVAGFAELQFNHFRPYEEGQKGLRGFSAGVNLRSFQFFSRDELVINPDTANRVIVDQYDYQLRYVRSNLYFTFYLPRPLRTKGEHYIRLDNFLIGEEGANFRRLDTLGLSAFTFSHKDWRYRSTHRLSYFHAQSDQLKSSQFLAALEYANYQGSTEREHYLKISTELLRGWTYAQNKSVDVRLFLGGFIFNTNRDFGAMPLQMSSRARGDYHYEELWLGRRAQQGDNNMAARQIAIADGGFKTPIATSVADGNSNLFLVALNLKSDLPIRLPFGVKWLSIKPYFDIGYFLNSAPSVVITQPADQIMFNGGLMFDIANGAAGIYFPLFGSRNLMQQVDALGSWGRRISFSVNTRLLNPSTIAKKIDF